MRKNLRHDISTRDWFNLWSNEYDRTLGSISFHRGLLDLVVKNSKIKPGDKVLDIGCGTGLLSLKLLKKSRCCICGIDNSRQMLEIFENKINKLGISGKVDLRCADARSLNFPAGTFDLVVSSVTLHHLKNKSGMLKKIYRMLKPGGRLIIGEVDMDTTGRHDDPERLKRILRVLEQEFIAAVKDVGVEAFFKMYDNGRKHILNQGEYCLSLKQWAGLCRKAGFRGVAIKHVPGYDKFGIVAGSKT